MWWSLDAPLSARNRAEGSVSLGSGVAALPDIQVLMGVIWIFPSLATYLQTKSRSDDIIFSSPPSVSFARIVKIEGAGVVYKMDEVLWFIKWLIWALPDVASLGNT